jgi:CHAT domain-containing protein
MIGVGLALTGILFAVAPADSLDSAKQLNAPLVQALRERRHEDAERIARRQLDLRRRYGASRDIDLATSLTYLSLAARNLGDIPVAEATARETLEIMFELYGQKSSNTATALNNLAGALRLKGDLVAAEALYRESLQLQTQELGENAPRLSGAHNNLGALLGQLGDSVGSEEHLRRAATLAREHYGPEHRNVALALVNLANALRGQERYAAALEVLDRAETIYEALADSIGRADAGRTRVRVLLDQGEPRRAIQEARALIEETIAASNENWLATARVEALLGRALLADTRTAEALPVLRRAQDALEKGLGPSHPETVNATIEFAEALVQSDDSAALRILETVAESYESARGRLAVSQSRATVELNSPYELLARARLHAGDERGAWRAAERHQARVLEELLDLAAADLPSEIMRRRAALLAQLGELEQELQRFDEAKLVDRRLRTVRYQELLRVEAEWSSLQQEILAMRPARPAEPTLEAVIAALPERGALIGWIPGAAYCIRADTGLRWVSRVAPLNAAASEALRLALRAPAQAPAFAMPTVDPAMQSGMRSLYDATVAAIDPFLNGLDVLFLIPGTELRGIPPEVLLDGQGRYLGDRFQLHLLPSAGLLRRLTRADRPIQSALFVGNPPFAGSPSRRFGALPPLENSAVEVERCAARFTASRRLLGGDASEGAIRELVARDELKSFDVIHIATHALADAHQPGRSTLVLSQQSLGDPMQAVLQGESVLDGAVSATEIARSWKIDAELVTLSACESALGRSAEGEGYLGFAHSLFEAGARRLLLSLWPVDDEATALLMERFYTNWIVETMPPARALQEAKSWLRQQDTGRFAHPYFWAAFVLLGA